MSSGFHIARLRLPRRTGRVPFPLRTFSVAPLCMAIDAIERELLRLARGRLDGSFVKTLALVRQLVTVDATYWRVAAWNRFVERKRKVMAWARRAGAEGEAARGELVEALGGVAACERWERRAAGLAAFPNRAPREARPDWYWTFKAEERAARENRTRETLTDEAPGRARGCGKTLGRGRVEVHGEVVSVRLPALPSRVGMARKACTPRGNTRAASPALDDAPVPVWPCEVLEGAVHDAVMARVAEAVAEKDAELARQAAAKREPTRWNERGGAPVRMAGHASNEPLYAALHGKRADP